MVAVAGWNPNEVRNYIEQSAIARGIDPNTAVAVANTEGLNNPVGDAGKSFGPFQLYTGGGLGNAFQAQTGLNPADYLNNWRQQVDFFLNWASQHGWNPGGIGLGSSYVGGTGGGSHGASAAGISNWQGLIGSFTAPIGSAISGLTITPETGTGVSGEVGSQPSVGSQPTTDINTTTSATTGTNPSGPSANLNFSDSISHSVVQVLLLLFGLVLLIGGIYLIGRKG